MNWGQTFITDRASNFASNALLRCAVLLALMLAAFLPSAAHAQTTQYTNSTDSAVGGINDGATACSPGNYFVRTFAVGTSYTVSDVNIGVLLAHTWRADLRMWLSSPAGTRIQIVNSNGGSADNFNVLLDSAIGTSVSTHSANDTATAGTVVPGYQRDFAPVSSLNAFNGESSTGAGQWTLEICDDAGGDSGTFYQADLFLSQVPTNYADLSVTKTVSNATPTSGAAIQYVVSLNNAASSPQTATGVVVSDLLPLGLTYTSHTVSAGGGTYTLGTGIWAVPSIAPNQTRTLTINATVSATAGATITNVAEVTASSHPDIDSTVNNGATGEDDYAARSLTVAGTRVAGVPPNLSVICGPNTPIVFDWDGKAWTAGTTNNNYTITGLGLINYALTTDVAFVTGSPAINATNTGGNGAGQQSLFLNMNNSNVFDVSTTVLTLPTAVPGMQFTMFDIDFGAGQWADKVTVTGSFNGATVIPTLTNNTANYVIGNTAIGDGSSSGDQVFGNVVVTFSSPVDTVTIVYGNHTTAPTNPGNQFMNIYDFSYCSPATNLSVTKISQVISDPISGMTNPKAIPGAVLQYCILVANAGSATVTSVSATDNIPGNVTYTAASMKSGANCGSAATVEDDDATGADENDPFGASISGTSLVATAATLGPADAYALTFQVIVD